MIVGAHAPEAGVDYRHSPAARAGIDRAEIGEIHRRHVLHDRMRHCSAEYSSRLGDPSNPNSKSSRKMKPIGRVTLFIAVADRKTFV